MMQKFLWVCTMLGSLIGLFFLLVVLTAAKGAPQEAAGAAIAVACAVIPYCLARAVSELERRRP